MRGDQNRVSRHAAQYEVVAQIAVNRVRSMSDLNGIGAASCSSVDRRTDHAGHLATGIELDPRLIAGNQAGRVTRRSRTSRRSGDAVARTTTDRHQITGAHRDRVAATGGNARV